MYRGSHRKKLLEHLVSKLLKSSLYDDVYVYRGFLANRNPYDAPTEYIIDDIKDMMREGYLYDEIVREFDKQLEKRRR